MDGGQLIVKMGLKSQISLAIAGISIAHSLFDTHLQGEGWNGSQSNTFTCTSVVAAVFSFSGKGSSN
jgi:hypothetical protein